MVAPGEISEHYGITEDKLPIPTPLALVSSSCSLLPSFPDVCCGPGHLGKTCGPSKGGRLLLSEALPDKSRKHLWNLSAEEHSSCAVCDHVVS